MFTQAMFCMGRYMHLTNKTQHIILYKWNIYTRIFMNITYVYLYIYVLTHKVFGTVHTSQKNNSQKNNCSKEQLSTSSLWGGFD